MAHANEDMLRKAYAAFATGDMDTVGAAFADDIVWHTPGRNAIAGDYRGKDEVFGFFGKIIEMTGGNFGIDVHDVLANDTHGAVLVHAHAGRNDRTWEGNLVHVIHLTDGKVSEVWVHEGDQHAVDAFFD